MQFFVNDQPLHVDTALTLQQMLKIINAADIGVALAINGKIISRSQWPEKIVQDGDRITLIKATAGG